tara:strand:+ start:533 stop:715 length:183 start_codon:yes stop_codon:yes gene_type:complete
VQEYCTVEYTLDASAAGTYKVLLPELHGATLLVPKASVPIEVKLDERMTIDDSEEHSLKA